MPKLRLRSKFTISAISKPSKYDFKTLLVKKNGSYSPYERRF